MATSNAATAGPPIRVRPYDAVARTFHWLVFTLLVVQYLDALLLVSVLPSSAEDTLVAWHFAVGSSVLVLMLARLAWRLTHTPPPPPASLPPGLQVLSRATHWTLYAVLIVLPFLGWAAASAGGAPVRLAGVIPLPPLVPKDDPFGKLMSTVHPAVALALLAVIVLHISGAMYHALIKHDGVLQRMLPLRSRG